MMNTAELYLLSETTRHHAYSIFSNLTKKSRNLKKECLIAYLYVYLIKESNHSGVFKSKTNEKDILELKYQVKIEQ